MNIIYCYAREIYENMKHSWWNIWKFIIFIRKLFSVLLFLDITNYKVKQLRKAKQEKGKSSMGTVLLLYNSILCSFIFIPPHFQIVCIVTCAYTTLHTLQPKPKHDFKWWRRRKKKKREKIFFLNFCAFFLQQETTKEEACTVQY